MSLEVLGDVGGESLRGADGRVRQGWRTSLGSLVGLAFSPSVVQVMSLGVFAQYLHVEFGWSVAQISLASTLLAVMTMIVSPLQGLLADRYGARTIILISLPLFGLGYAALSLMSGALSQFYLGWALLPLLGIGLWPASWVKATSSWFDRRLGFAIGVASMGIGIGAALMPIVIEGIVRTWGWRSAFAAIGIGSIVIAWPIARCFVYDRADQIGRAPAADLPATGPALPSTLWLLLAAFVLLGIYSTAILFHLVTILTDAGMSRATAVMAQSVLGVMMVAGRLGSGFVVDRVTVRIVMPVLALAAAAALGVLTTSVGDLAGIVAAAVIGLLIGAEIDVLGFVVKRYFGTARFGTLYGVLFAVFQGGGAVGVLAVGALRDGSGSYTGGLIVLACACLGAAAAFALLGPYRFGIHAPAARMSGTPAVGLAPARAA